MEKPRNSFSDNSPDIWSGFLPKPMLEGHKYDRGHVAIFGAPELTGATRLAASACSRIGAGLVSVLANKCADIYRITLPADIMVRSCNPGELKSVNVMLGGSGGIERTHQSALLENHEKCARVFDADAIPDYSNFRFLDAGCVLTPHEGEFARSFPNVSGSRQEKALEAAKTCGATVVLKGAHTVIAGSNGRVVVNNHAGPYLAKAGTGDVLAGMIAGLLAQGMSIFEASCAAVWMHGEAALRFGPGLIASDISDQVPAILKDLLG